MGSGHYYCDILYFHTKIWWCFDDDIIALLIGLPDNVYSDASCQKIGKKGRKGSDDILYIFYRKYILLYHTVMNFLRMICLNETNI